MTNLHPQHNFKDNSGGAVMKGSCWEPALSCGAVRAAGVPPVLPQPRAAKAPGSAARSLLPLLGWTGAQAAAEETQLVLLLRLTTVNCQRKKQEQKQLHPYHYISVVQEENTVTSSHEGISFSACNGF